MLVDNSGGNFEKDKLLDADTDVEAVLLGVAYVGKHQSKKFGTEDEYELVDQAIMAYEIVEEDTQVERGGEENPHMVNRIITEYVKYSSNEKSRMYGRVKALDPKAVGKQNGKPVIDLLGVVGKPIILTLGVNNKGTYNTITDVSKVTPKLAKTMAEGEHTPYLFHADQGMFEANGHKTQLEDVPVWMLKMVTEADNADELGMIDAVEEFLAELEADKSDDTELEGDRLPDDKKSKADKKKATPKDEDKNDDGEGDEGGEEKTTRRSRRSQKEDEPEEEKGSRRSRRSRKPANDELREELKAKQENDPVAFESYALDKGYIDEDGLTDLADGTENDEEFDKKLLDLVVEAESQK